MSTPDPNCKHHWLIDQHNHGICKHCGGEKDFPGIGDIPDINSWRGGHHGDEDPVEGGSDMADRDVSEEHKPEPVAVHVKEGVPQLKCPYCPFETPYPAALGAHKFRKHGVRGKAFTEEEQNKAQQASVELEIMFS
jgi:hypothetical protein